MATPQVYRTNAPEGTEETVLVPSFTTDGKAYSVDPELGTCTCRRFEIHRNCVKHVVLADALVGMRRRRDLLPTEDLLATGRLTGLAKRIFAPMRKRETVGDSYDLLLEVSGYRYATARLVEAARNRHKKVVAESLRRAA